MNKIYHPTRQDHFSGKGGGERLKKWLEDHNLPVSGDKFLGHQENLDTMIKATGGKIAY